MVYEVVTTLDGAEVLRRAKLFFAPIHAKLDALLDPSTFIGRAPEQVDAFLADEVKPALKPYTKALKGASQLAV